MSDKMGQKKYSLVIEPHGSYEKYVVYFTYDENNGYQIKKTPFRTNEEIAKFQKGKTSIFELDVFTSSVFQDNADLFKKLGIYQNVHNVYIQFKASNGYLKRLPVIYDENVVFDRLCAIKNGQIVDDEQKEEYIKMLIDDRTFFTTYLSHDIYKTKTVENLVYEVRKSGVYVNQSGGSTESKEWLFINKQQLKEELSKYHIYRGFVIAEQITLQFRKEKEELMQVQSETKPKVYEKKPVYPGYEPQEYKQFKLEGFGE